MLWDQSILSTRVIFTLGSKRSSLRKNWRLSHTLSVLQDPTITQRAGILKFNANCESEVANFEQTYCKNKLIASGDSTRAARKQYAFSVCTSRLTTYSLLEQLRVIQFQMTSSGKRFVPRLNTKLSCLLRVISSIKTAHILKIGEDENI